MKSTSFKEEQLVRSSIIKWGKELYNCGMVKGSGGNISIKLNDSIIFTPSGSFLGHLSEDCLSKTDLKGNLIDGLRPTKEVPMHLAAYRSNSQTKAVVHTHSIYSTALASTLPPNTYMPIYLPSVAAKVGKIKITNLEIPGSTELASTVSDKLKGAIAVLLSNHGIIATGKDIEEAVSIAYEIEENAHIHFITNGNCRPLSEETLENILKIYK